MEIKQNKPKSTFIEKGDDPGFLVAKGRFFSPHEKDLQDLIRKGIRTDDPEILLKKNQIDADRKVAEKEHVKNLAHAIFTVVNNHGSASVRCVGRNAVYNATKAMAIAKTNCSLTNGNLSFGVHFEEGNLGKLRNEHHVENVTALVFSATLSKGE